MKRLALILALALGSAAPALADEFNPFAPPKPVPDSFILFADRSIQEHKSMLDGPDRQEFQQRRDERGGGNFATVHQHGDNHRAALRQSGTNSSFRILQFGNGAEVSVHQPGDNRVGGLIQFNR